MELAWSGCDAVLADESAESINSCDPARVVEQRLRGVGSGNLEINPTMGSRFVVVVDELDKDAFEVTLVSDEQPVQAFDPHGANESLGECVRAVLGPAY